MSFDPRIDDEDGSEEGFGGTNDDGLETHSSRCSLLCPHLDALLPGFLSC
jgi:hypothetical protein